MVGPAIVRGSISPSVSKYFSLANCVTLFILLAFFPCSTHAQFSQRFAPTVPPTYAAGGANPYLIALTDMNGDGHPDLLVATTQGASTTIAYLPGNGKGAFAAPKTAVTLPSSDTYPLATGDFNHDGHLDLVVMTSSNQVVVLLNTGDGTFVAQPAISCPNCNNYAAAAGDFNRDGELDLLFSASDGLQSTGAIVMFPGIGNGKFKTPVISTGIQDVGGGLVAGDFNRDGLLDVVTSDGFGSFQTAFGNGNGTFRAGPFFRDGDGEFGQVSAVDLRKDGKLDLVYVNAGALQYGYCGNSNLYVALGNGDGSFQTPVAYSPGQLTYQAFIGDFNGDGKPDILSVNYASPSISVLLGNGSGGFAPALDLRTPPLDGALAADLNGDGKTDVVLSLTNGEGVMLAQSGGIFHAPRSLELFSVPVAPPSAPVDLNRDGIPDLLMLTDNDSTGCRYPGDVEGILPVLSTKGVALSTLGNFVDSFYPVFSVGAGHFSRSGYVDAAVIGQYPYNSLPNYIGVNLNNGSGNFNQLAQNLPTTSATTFAVGDFNGDGLSDLALLVGDAVQIELGKGGNNFSSPVGYPVGSDPVAITVRDVNGDGRQDLVVVNKGGGTVSVLLGNGNGTFAAQKVFSVGSNPVATTLADFNRDGKVDIAVANQNNVSVLLGTGTGSFGTAKTFAAASGLQSIAATDLRQNGLTDLLVGSANGNLVWLSGLGNGTFAAPQTYAAQGASFLDVADFNGDGAPDVVLPGPNGYAVTVLYNQGGTRVTLNSSAGTVIAGSTIKLTAKVAATVAGAGTPTGSVVFYDGSKAIGTGMLSSGTATLTTTKLAQGTHTFKAIYSGSTNFNTHQSSSVTITVKP